MILGSLSKKPYITWVAWKITIDVELNHFYNGGNHQILSKNYTAYLKQYKGPSISELKNKWGGHFAGMQTFDCKRRREKGEGRVKNPENLQTSYMNDPYIYLIHLQSIINYLLVYWIIIKSFIMKDS